MSTYKRRIVYLSDKEWEGLGFIAKARQSTISATIRAELKDVLFEEFARLDPAFQATLPTANEVRGILSQTPGGFLIPQAARDDLLRKINRGSKP